MNKFHETFKKLIKESGIKQVDLAKILGLTPQAFSYYANGREPSYDLLIKISRHFNVTIDYLLGESEYNHHEDILNVNSEINELLHNNPGLDKLLKLASFKELISKASKTFDTLTHKDLLAGIGLEEIDSMDLSEKTYRIAFSEYLKGTLDKLINDIGSIYFDNVKNKVIQLLSLDSTKIKRNK